MNSMSRRDFQDCRHHLLQAQAILRDSLRKLTDAANRGELRPVESRVESALLYLDAAETEQAGDECEHCGAPPEKQAEYWHGGSNTFNRCPACGADLPPLIPKPQFSGEELDVTY